MPGYERMPVSNKLGIFAFYTTMPVSKECWSEVNVRVHIGL